MTVTIGVLHVAGKTMETRLGDEDDIVEVSCANAKPSVPSKLMQILQEIELLKALSKSSTPISLEYDKFIMCAKKINPLYCDVVIKSAWSRAIAKQRRCTRTTPCRPQASSFVIDLTEQNDALERPPAPPSNEVADVEIIDVECLQDGRNIVPVALIANPFFQETESASQVSSDDNTINGVVTSGIEVLMETSADVLTSNNNCVEEVINESSSEALADDVHPNNDETLLEEKSDSEYETNQLFDDFDIQSDSGIDSKDSGLGLAGETICQKLKDVGTNTSFAKKIRSENMNISRHHVSVRAKIKHKDSIHSVKSKLGKHKKTKFMSKAEFKLFKAEQKKLKLLEKRELKVKELEIVSNRLVDVLIPKYYKKVL